MTENHTGKTTMDSTCWEDDLESHRYELTRVLRPDRYFEKFRSERVMDESDTQIINNETKNPTRDKKAGCFLDTVRERGPHAYKLLLECVEADHPELYKKITGKDPEPKSWTMGLSRSCSCECHDDRISLDLMEAYKKEKQQNISLKQEMTKLAKTVDTLKDEKLKLKHKNSTLTKQVDVLQSETGDVLKLKADIQWKRVQICDLQAKAYEAQTQLIASNDTLRKANLNNNALQNQLREAQAKLHLHRKKSTRLEQERSTDSMKTSDALRALVMQLTELGLERNKMTDQVAQDTCKPPVTNNDDLHDQTTLEILMADKQEAVTKCEETVNELVDVRKKLYDVHEAKVKLEAANEELETNDTLLREEREMLAERLQMAQEELTQVSAERSQAISERNRSFEETARSMFERDELVKKLNKERQSFLSQARTLFEFKSKVQKLKRDKKLLLQDRPPSVVSTVSMEDGSNDSKRSSGAPDGGYLDGTSSTGQDATKPTTTTGRPPSSNHLEDKRSVSIGEIKQTTFDFDDDDDLNDYEYPIGRDRSQRVTDIPALHQRRSSNVSKNDIATALGSNRSSCRSDTNSCNVTGGDSVDERDNGVLESLPNDVDDRVATLWSEFDYVGPTDAPDKTSDTESPATGRRGIRHGVSTDVNVGSLKDKNKRGPGPRLSSYEIQPSNYMMDVTIDRRSKTLGCDPDDPDPLKGVFDPLAKKTAPSPDDNDDTL